MQSEGQPAGSWQFRPDNKSEGVAAAYTIPSACM